MKAPRRAVPGAFLALTILAGAGATAPAPEAIPSGGAPVALRVMTFNIHAGQEGLDAVAAAIRDVRPDVVALQEVDVHWSERSAFVDQTAALAAATGMEVRFAPIYSLDPERTDGPRREYGLALLSRFPVRGWRNLELTRISTLFGGPPHPMPGFLEATLDVEGTPVRVFSTHLDYRPDPATRTAEVRETLEVLAEASGPTILMGDLNAPPDAEALRPLFGPLRDAWAVARPDAGPGDGLTYPAEAPVKRIDYVLVTPDVQVVDAQVVDTRASDHRPVVVSLRVGR